MEELEQTCGDGPAGLSWRYMAWSRLRTKLRESIRLQARKRKLPETYKHLLTSLSGKNEVVARPANLRQPFELDRNEQKIQWLSEYPEDDYLSEPQGRRATPTSQQEILGILGIAHPNRQAALRELDAPTYQLQARLRGGFEDHRGPREDARELQRADYQRIRDVCGLDMTKGLSFTRYKGLEQATAIAKSKAEYPWMTALEAKATLIKAVSGSLRACTH
jgi:hypothetical protein